MLPRLNEPNERITAIMRYFTADIWAGWQRKGAAFDRAQRKWEKNLARYKASLRRVAPRLGKRHGRFFTHHSLHDGRVLFFAVSDWPSPTWQKGMVPETRVKMMVLAGTTRVIVYSLSYTGVSDISVRTKNDLFPLANSRFGDWGYDELLPERRGSFRHNILFQTGTEVSVAFRYFRFSVMRGTPKLLKWYNQSRLAQK